MIRREFLKNAAVLASGLAAKISYGAPCPPPLDGAVNEPCNQSGQSNLEVRTRGLTSGNTPVLNVNYFRSEEGSPSVANNTTIGQGAETTWQVQGIYYDPIRRRMHQLDRVHGGTVEHAYYDEVDNQWHKVNAGWAAQPAGHWRSCAFVPETGFIWHHREGTDDLYYYDPDDGVNGTWSTTTSHAELSSTDAGNLGFHPNLFGPNNPGCLTGRYNPSQNFVAWNIREEAWYDLNQSGNAGDLGYFLYRGWSVYLPGRDELIMTSPGGGVAAFAAGTGLETDLSTSNSAELRNNVPKAIHPYSDNSKCYACIHPRQPDVILAMDAANSNVYYTKDGGTTPWVTTATSGITHPFSSELTNYGYHTVGSLPYHGVVAGATTFTTNNTKFVYWKPPLV